MRRFRSHDCPSQKAEIRVAVTATVAATDHSVVYVRSWPKGR